MRDNTAASVSAPLITEKRKMINWIGGWKAALRRKKKKGVHNDTRNRIIKIEDSSEKC